MNIVRSGSRGLAYAALMTVLAASPNSSLGQDYYSCGTGAGGPEGPGEGTDRGGNCTAQGSDFLNKYRTPGYWIPDQLTPIKTVRLNIVICRDALGQNGWQEGPDVVQGFALLEGMLNQRYSASPPAGYPLPCQPAVPNVPDSRIRFKIDHIYYLNMTASYTNPGAILNMLWQTNPEARTGLNHIFLDPIYCTDPQNTWPNGNLGLGYFTHYAGEQFVISRCLMWETPLNLADDYGFIDHIAHEYAHALGMHHTYDQSPPPGEPLCPTNYDFLDDVFGTCPPSAPYVIPGSPCNCPTPGCACLLNAACFFNLFPGVSFPATSNVPPSTYLSPKSMGRMHRAASLFNRVFVMNNTPLHKYIEEKYSYEIPKLIAENETWDFAIKMYQDIRVETGATLTVKCEVRMPVDGRIIVEPGARLIVDGGLITAAHAGYFWSGIEAWGTSSEHQFPADHPTYQGLVVLKNGGVVEHAREGIQTMKPGDWNSVGGVVQVLGNHNQVGGTFLNCRRAVSFVKYQNYFPGHPEIRQPNNSVFNYAEFKYDDNYRDGSYVYAPITMWGVDGVVFRACTFENGQQATQVSSQLGKGIYSIDANYTVRGNCTVSGLPYGTPCPTGNLDRSTFRGFDHGISALGSPGGSRSFLVRDTDFDNEICGVYASGVVGYQVKNCTFEMGGRQVVMDNPDEIDWIGRHRGIYSTESWAFAVDDNTLSRTGTYNLTEGIVIGYSRDHNDVVFRNHAGGLERGYIGEGIAADLEDSYTGLRGLQFLCNENTINSQDLWSRLVTTAPGPEQEFHTIRTNQGYSYRPADNTFDNLPGLEGVSDFKVTTVNGNITYWHRNTDNFVPTYITQNVDPPSYLGPAVATTIPANNCASKIMRTIPSDPGHPSGIALEPIEDHLGDEKLAYGNTRYLYDQLIDGGSTDEVVLEISSAWPQGYWDLRDYLLSKSPYLSVAALKDAMNKDGFPDAMRTEICIANPEATQRDGFIRWLQYECSQPLPEYLIGNIVASWETKTYRTALEGEMAYHHAEMSQAANMLLHRHQEDEDGAQPEELRAVWQEVRSPAARYAEALTWLDEGNYVNADAVIQSIPLEHDLKAPEMLERQRMLDLIALLGPILGNGRNEAQLSLGEVDALEALRGDAYDRPATWLSNLLCFHYERCRPPMTGGEDEGGGAKSARQALAKPLLAKADPQLTLHPNPASTWVAFDYDLRALAKDAKLIVLDATGREIWRAALVVSKTQVLWDVRGVQPGTYAVMLENGGLRLTTERLVLQQ